MGGNVHNFKKVAENCRDKVVRGLKALMVFAFCTLFGCYHNNLKVIFELTLLRWAFDHRGNAYL